MKIETMQLETIPSTSPAPPPAVSEEAFDHGPLPLVVRATGPVDAVAWAAEARPYLEDRLRRHGAVLLRGFAVDSAEGFQALVQASSGDPLAYLERSSPRSQVSGNVYTSTEHPPTESIFLHNEQSYNLRLPRKICFFCLQPSEEGGETPLADCRGVYRRIDPTVRRRFEERGYAYVRNFWGVMGLSWEDAFQTRDPAAVAEYCRGNGIEHEWLGRRLRTRQVRRVSARHPASGDATWCNHLTFFHVSTLDPAKRDLLRASFAEDDLPNNTFYGDGASVEPEVMDHLRECYAAETVAFPWQRGDVVLVDNLLVAHGRRPFRGARRVLVAMAEPLAWADLPPAAAAAEATA